MSTPCTCPGCTSPNGTCPPVSFMSGKNLVNIPNGGTETHSFSIPVYGAVCYFNLHTFMISLGRGETFSASGNNSCTVSLSGDGGTLTITNNSGFNMVASYFGIV